jgi:hypothetical protein
MLRQKANTGVVKPEEETKLDGVEPETQNNNKPKTPNTKIIIKKVTVTEQPKKNVIEVKKEDFDRMMKLIEKQSKDIDLLYKTADKGRIARELNKGQENLIKKVKVRTWDDTGKVILGWKLITNKCEVVMGRWVEEQTTTIVLDDGETLTIPLLEFYRKTLNKIEADIIGTNNEFDEKNNKVVVYKVQFDNGKTLLLNEAFVN